MPFKKVGLVANTSWFLSRFVMPLAGALTDLGVEVHLIAPADRWTSDLVGPGLYWHGLRMSRHGISPPMEGLALLQLTRLYRELELELVHHHTIKPLIYGSLAAKATGVSVVVNSVVGLGHVYSSEGSRIRSLRRAVTLLARFALKDTHICFLNRGDERQWSQLGISRHATTSQIGHGVDTEIFLPSREAEGVPLVVYVGRMTWAKGAGRFYAAARRLRAAGVVARFVLVGEPDKAARDGIPASVLDSWQRSGVVEWWGFRDDMAAVYRQAAIVVHPSTYGEGVPTVVLEAGASARSVVVGRDPGSAEVVIDGVTGRVIDTTDEGQLAATISELIHDAPLRQALGRAARERVEAHYARANVDARYLQLYRRAFAAGRNTRLTPA